MKIIGLTGQSGAGKTTVSEALSAHGWFIVDGDECAREAVQPGSVLLCRLAEEFGDDIILSDGTLDRRLLARRAFVDNAATLRLNEVMHPEITRLIFSKIDKAHEEGFEIAVIDAAALFESGIAKKCSVIVAVVAPESVRLQRIIQRDGISRDDALIRIRAQRKEEYYRQFSDIIIRNYLPYSLDEELERLYETIDDGRPNTSQTDCGDT